MMKRTGALAFVQDVRNEGLMSELSIGCFLAAEALHPQSLTHAEALHFQQSAVPSALLLCQNYTPTLQMPCFQGSFFFLMLFSFYLIRKG